MVSRTTASRIVLTLAAAAVALGSACFGSDSDAGDGEEDVDHGEPRLITPGTLTVCVDAPKYPFAFQDGNQNWLGSDVEIVQALAADLDLTVAFVDVPFDGIWRAPAAGTCDLAAAAMTITDARQAEAAFTDPYLDADQSLLVRDVDAAQYASLSALADRPIGVKAGTTSEAYLAANLPADATVVTYPDTEPLFVALGAGEVDGVVADFPINGYRSTLDSAVSVVEQYGTGERYGFAAASDNLGLVDDLNDALEDFLASDEYQALRRRWFGE